MKLNDHFSVKEYLSFSLWSSFATSACAATCSALGAVALNSLGANASVRDIAIKSAIGGGIIGAPLNASFLVMVTSFIGSAITRSDCKYLDLNGLKIHPLVFLLVCSLMTPMVSTVVGNIFVEGNSLVKVTMGGAALMTSAVIPNVLDTNMSFLR